MRKLLLLSACLAAGVGPSAADDKKKEDKATAEVVKVAVSHKVDAKLADQFELGLPERTEVWLMLRHAGKPLLGLGEGSKVTVMKDDKGNSLLGKLADREKRITQETALDRSAVLASLAGKVAPGKGAAKVLIEGELVLAHGADEKTETKEKFAFTEGGKARLGDFEVRVTREKGFRGGPEIEITSPAAFNVVKGVSVTDGDGKAVEAVAERDYGIGKWAARYVLKAPLKQGKLAVTYYARVEEVKVALDLSVGLAD
jgi:hypothetical protein